MLRTFCLSLIIVVTPIALLAKPPGRDISPKADAPKEAKRIKLEGVTNWGDFTQTGPGQFTLDNHPIWYGVGRIREDGKVMLLWTLRSTSEPCPGVYTIEPDGSLIGIWGYSHDTRIEDNGELTGNVRPDRVFVLPPPVPEI